MADRSRAERLERARVHRKRLELAVGALVVASIVTAVALVSTSRHPRQEAEETPKSLALASEETSSPSLSTTSTIPIEVPLLTGISLSEAELIARSAGLLLTKVPTPAGDAPEGVVLSQEPAAGERVAAGSAITLTYADTAAAAAASAEASGELVVCIDPGHQAAADASQEAVGPGATETKAKVTGGAVGVVTRQPEYQLALTLSLKIEERLERYGVHVVMTRTIPDVHISNAQRAEVANQAEANLFVRIHADSSTNADRRGISTLYAGGNDWVAPIESESLKAAGLLQQQLLASTGAEDAGVVKRSDLAGFNYSKVPAVLVETGFLSNPVDDRQLADAMYQDKLADAITRGILEYLGVTGQ